MNKKEERAGRGRAGCKRLMFSGGVTSHSVRSCRNATADRSTPPPHAPRLQMQLYDNSKCNSIRGGQFKSALKKGDPLATHLSALLA